MKKILFLTLAVAAGLPSFSFGQAASPAASPAPSAVAPSAPASTGGAALLSPQEQQIMENASAKAQQDPKVLATIDEMRTAMKNARDAMIAKDKAIGPLLNQIESGAAPGGHPPKLTPEQFMELGAARKAIVGTPEAAAWQKATNDYHSAVEAALIAADPAVEPILQKVAMIRMRAQSGGATSGGTPPPQ